MLKKLLRLILFCAAILILNIFNSFALETSTAPAGETPPSKLENRYREINKLEKMRLFRLARRSYLETLHTYLQQAKSPKFSKKLIQDLPVAVSLAFRLSIVTGKNNFFNNNKLIQQIEFYNDSNTEINNLLSFIINLSELEDSLLRRRLIGLLLFARGYNQLGFAYKLLQAIPWKNYIVYPPADIQGMIQSSIQDFDQSLMLEGVPYQRYNQELVENKSELITTPSIVINPENSVSVNTVLNAYDEMKHFFYSQFNENIENLPIYKTYLLINFENDPEILSQIQAKRCYYQVFNLLDYYHSEEIQEILAQSKDYYTLEDILSPVNKPIFKALSQMVGYLGLRK